MWQVLTIFLVGVNVCVNLQQSDAFSASFLAQSRQCSGSVPMAPSFLRRTLSPPPRHRCQSGQTWMKATSPGAGGGGSGNYEFALIFDCDGVIIETEELHRLAYNAAFKEEGLEIDGAPVEWSVEYYDVLQNTVGGGRGKMNFHFRNTTGGAWPTSENGKVPAPRTEEEKTELIDELQDLKTDLYKEMIHEKATPRPGVIELMDEALDDPTIAVGVCSASTKAAVMKVLDVTIGEERRKKLDVCILGDDVARLKPDPLIYRKAAEKLNMEPSHCVVVEDSIVGVKAAKGAGMKCLVTYTKSTEKEKFYGYGCDAKVPDLGSRSVTLSSIFDPMRERGADAEILVGIKDTNPQMVGK